MCKLVCWFFLWIPIVYSGLVSAQDAFGAYPYPQSRPEAQLTQVPRQAPGILRWRPLDGESEGAADSLSGRHGGSYPGFGDYTDEPPGVPAGTYRQIEERHTITPNLEGYRFRPIEPEEQVRNRSRNETQARSNRRQIYSRSVGSATGNEAYGGGLPPGVIFRPDPRLDNGARRAPPRYAFPMGGDIPRFPSR